ncbi:aminotransferase DegT [Tenacibaculum sp. E3R01]|nr:aminotransferase DegT [Tenacibaculum sp. E3R01]
MIPLYKPHMPTLPLIQEILDSGNLAYGNYGREFEKKIGDYIENKNIITTNAYNMAILVAMSTLDIKSGDSVIASPMTCLASSQPLISMGINIIWADINPKTGTLCPDSVKNKIGINCKAIIHNHYCGHVGFIDEINNIGREKGIPVIDDCIEAFGSEYKGNKLGNVGTDVTIFSFNPVRIPNTLDGGAVVFKNENLYKKSLLVRDAGIDRSCFRDELGEINPLCDIKLIGHSATMGEVNSYIGTRQMEQVENLIKIQRENASVWCEELANSLDIVPINNQEGKPNYWVYGVLAKNKRDTIIKYRKLGYYSSGVHINNDIYSVFKSKDCNLSGVNEFNDQFVALPTGWWFNK